MIGAIERALHDHPASEMLKRACGELYHLCFENIIGLFITA
jgi:hypothetical protein